MKRDEYDKSVHRKELKSLIEIVSRIRRGVFWVVSVRFDREMIGGGRYRLTVYLREKE